VTKIECKDESSIQYNLLHMQHSLSVKQVFLSECLFWPLNN